MRLLHVLLNIMAAVAVSSGRADGMEAEVDKLPVLRYEMRSDWLNVKEGCNGGAKAIGDGKADDTKALQDCFSALNGSLHTGNATVFMPAGKYRITKTLIVQDALGATIVGTGETTVLVWDGKRSSDTTNAGNMGTDTQRVGTSAPPPPVPGATDATMILSDGMSRSRLMGFVLDGTNGADVGVEHRSIHSLFETRIRHQNQKFINFKKAGIRIGYGGNFPGRVESAEILYENCVFDSCGWGCKGLPYPPMTANGCGGVAALNFNDYDNLFDGCHFRNNTYGIYTDGMANVYVRNCRFDVSSMSDIWLAASAGNSVRRSVSQGSSVFVGAPVRDPAPVNPTVLWDNRIDTWTNTSGAITYALRGPVVLVDNVFTNGPKPNATANQTLYPVQPRPPVGSNATWILSRNVVDGALVTNASLVAAADMIQIEDLDANGSALPSKVAPTPLTPHTRFLKATWPVPTKVFDIRAFGANGSVDDSAAIQAAIDAASKAGNGAIAYIPHGTFKIQKPLTVTGSHFFVGGSGYGTSIEYSLPCAADPKTCDSIAPAILVKSTEDVTIQMMQVKAPANVSKIQQVRGAKCKYDGVYLTDSNNRAFWNSTGLFIDNLGKGDVAHIVHLDGNLNVTNCAAATVLVGMMIESTFTLNGPAKHGTGSRNMDQNHEERLVVDHSTMPASVSSSSPPPPLPPLGVGILTIVGLVRMADIIVNDDQSVVITDNYAEQMTEYHVMLSGSGSKTPGRVSLQAAKTEISGQNKMFVAVDNYHGSLFYGSSFFMEKEYPSWEVKQTGSQQFDMQLFGCAFNQGSKAPPVVFSLDSGGKTGDQTLFGNQLCNFTDSSLGENQTMPNTDVTAEAMALVSLSFDDFRRLGWADLQLNHPSLVAQP
eukprot:m.1367853 g.1367853  ORF g.1367853 m.1367853 type:complete len:882 (-) comp24953_c0_seq26:1953-4598(-)